MTRDLSKKQFIKALERNGMKLDYFGYVDVGNGHGVYRFNAGDRLRSQLAYLIEQQKRVKEF